jgi:hypothetical protein
MGLIGRNFTVKAQKPIRLGDCVRRTGVRLRSRRGNSGQ